MSDPSDRRRLAARGGIAAALLALPMTASIGYAEANAVPQAAQTFSPQSPIAPLSPTAPAAPKLSYLSEIEKDDWALSRAELAEERAEQERERAEERHERAVEARELAEEAHRQAREMQSEYEDSRREWAQGRANYAEGRKRWAEGRAEWAKSRAEYAKSIKHTGEASVRNAHALAYAQSSSHWSREDDERIEKVVEQALARAPTVVESCRYPEEPVHSEIGEQGRVTMYVCDTAGDRIALKALRTARAGIVRNGSLSQDVREDILRDLDQEIAELSR